MMLPRGRGAGGISSTNIETKSPRPFRCTAAPSIPKRAQGRVGDFEQIDPEVLDNGNAFPL